MIRIYDFPNHLYLLIIVIVFFPSIVFTHIDYDSLPLVYAQESLNRYPGSIYLDRTVYPIPWGNVKDFDISESKFKDMALFPIHPNSIAPEKKLNGFLNDGDLVVYLRIEDKDFDISKTIDSISKDLEDEPRVGPIEISVKRGSETVILGYAGGTVTAANTIFVGDNPTLSQKQNTRQYGPLKEIEPNSGIFEIGIPIRYTDGPPDKICPHTVNYSDLGPRIVKDTNGADDEMRFSSEAPPNESFCILSGDILQAKYRDSAGVSGDKIDSATFDLQTGILQSDKSAYEIGSDMILTLVEADFDLDSRHAESYTLGIIGWNPEYFRTIETQDSMVMTKPVQLEITETGNNTGIFQTTVSVPDSINGHRLSHGEKIGLEYIDWAPSGQKRIGLASSTVQLNVSITENEKEVNNVVKKQLFSLIESFSSKTNKLSESKILASDIVEIVTVIDSPESIEFAIDEISQSTAFLEVANQEARISQLDKVSSRADILKEYRDKLSEPQEWPFARGQKTSLIDVGDYLAKVNWVSDDVVNFRQVRS